jgi:ATP-binding cassette subfamily B protein
MAEINVNKPLQRFWKLLALEKKELLNIYFFAILSGLIYLSIPLGIQSIINLLFGGLVSTSLVILISFVVFGVLLNGWLTILQMKVNERIQRRIFTRFSLQFAYKIPRLDLMAIDDYYLPELVNRFFDTASLQKGLTKVLLEFPSASVQILFGLILLSLYHAAFLAFGAVLLGLMYVILRLTYPKGIATSLEESNYKYEVGYWLEEVARTIKTLKFMGMNDFPARKADVLVSGYLDARAEHFKVLQIQYWAFVMFKVIITAALLILGALLVIKQQINIGQFIASEIVILMLLNSVEKIISSLDVVYDMLTSLEKVSKILDKPIERENGLDILEISKAEGVEIKAENLSYRFKDDDQYVLKNLNFEIKAGEKVCIFGSQSSGKTTLLKLFTGGYLSYDGNLLFNSYPLGNYNLQKLRQEIGILPATTDLFSGTLYENLTLGDNSITTSFILEVAEQTGLLSYLQSLNNGLDTMVDTIGKRLPRNTINKILLSRALLTKPRLLLLEDCWSSLEKVEQEKMVKNLTDPKHEFTLIAVTNDENFARNCNKVILLEEGKIVECGSFEMVSQTAEYQKMFKRLSL